jgi:hypothetical protein
MIQTDPLLASRLITLNKKWGGSKSSRSRYSKTIKSSSWRRKKKLKRCNPRPIHLWSMAVALNQKERKTNRYLWICLQAPRPLNWMMTQYIRVLYW